MTTKETLLFSSGFLGEMIKSFKLWWLIYDADAVSPDFSWSTSSGKRSVPHSYSAIICHISKGKTQLAHFSAQSYFNWKGLQIMCLPASVFRRWVCPKPLECFCPIQKEKYLCLYNWPLWNTTGTELLPCSSAQKHDVAVLNNCL